MMIFILAEWNLNHEFWSLFRNLFSLCNRFDDAMFPIEGLTYGLNWRCELSEANKHPYTLEVIGRPLKCFWGLLELTAPFLLISDL